LVELLIAVSIFSVVAIAIYSTFNSGVSVLRRIKNKEFQQERILLKAESMSRQLREQPALKKQLFQGVKDRISISAIVDFVPCRVIYYLEGSSVMRATDRLSEIIMENGKINPEIKSKPNVFLSSIDNLKFSYLYLDLAKNKYNWLDTSMQDILPEAVRMAITSKNQEYAWIVFLPKN